MADVARELGVSIGRIQQVVNPSSQVRRYIRKKANGKCQNCGLAISYLGQIHDPQGRCAELDGYDEVGDLILLCVYCHRLAHTSDPHQVRQATRQTVKNAVRQ